MGWGEGMSRARNSTQRTQRGTEFTEKRMGATYLYGLCVECRRSSGTVRVRNSTLRTQRCAEFAEKRVGVNDLCDLCVPL
jgi:hypothetical protein